jgi:hypothetical protein
MYGLDMNLPRQECKKGGGNSILLQIVTKDTVLTPVDCQGDLHILTIYYGSLQLVVWPPNGVTHNWRSLSHHFVKLHARNSRVLSFSTSRHQNIYYRSLPLLNSFADDRFASEFTCSVKTKHSCLTKTFAVDRNL